MFLKVVFFRFQGRGRSFKGAIPNVATDSKFLILEVSNEVSFVSELQWIHGQIYQNLFSKNQLSDITCPSVYA